MYALDLGSRDLSINALLVDDEQDICESVKDLLELENINVQFIINPHDLPFLLEEKLPDVLLLDQNLAGQRGTDWILKIKEQRRYAHIPIIMLTGNQGEQDKVEALNIGADDYVVKPFSPSELAARIRAVLRRVNPGPVSPETIESNGLVVNRLTHQVTLHGKEISLTLTEFRIVFELLNNKNEVLSRDHLREMALGKTNVTDRTIDVHLASLRKKLGSWADSIKTIRGVGYRYSF
ncbi:MAG: response regulator transcription factor [Bdellovibrionales bacterium]|nr:response regulator transcription factor [Bdellovibrionales bacterium]